MTKNYKEDYSMYALYDLIATIIKAYEPDTADEFFWLDAIFGLFK